MPDWLSHIGLTYIIIWIISKLDRYDEKCRKYYAFFLIGGVMPDLERIFAIIAELLNDYQLKEFFSVVFTSGFHTILGVLCMAVAMTSFFPKEESKLVFISFLLGGLSHLLLDAIMWPWPNMGLTLFYPFFTGPRGSFSFHLVWPGGFVPLIIISIMTGFTFLIDAIQKKSLLSLTPLRQLFSRNKLK